jgi:glycosyltransferase involved in cell wall biosynthesis
VTPIRVRAFYTRYPHWGAHTGFRQMCRYLSPASVDLSLQPVSDGDADWPLPENPLNQHVRRYVNRRGMVWYKLSDLAAEIAATPAALTNAVDIIHFVDAEHTGQYLPGWIKRWRRSRVKTIGTFHQPPELLPGLVNPDIVASLDRVVVVSPSQIPYFRAFLPADRVLTILYGIDVEFFRPPEVRITDGVFRCITVGHWMRDWRAIRAVAEAFRPRQHMEFHIVTNRVTGLEGLPNVHRHQNVDDEGLRGLYQQADVLFLPLENATANNSLLEAIACGLPVVSTRIESVLAYVDETMADLVAGNEPEALVAAICRLHDDPDRRAKMGAAARARAEALAWSRLAVEWEGVYATLVKQER